MCNRRSKFAINCYKFAINLLCSIRNFTTRDNAKMLKQLKPGFKRTINWNKYQSKRSIERQKTILAYLIDPSFQRVNKYFF